MHISLISPRDHEIASWDKRYGRFLDKYGRDDRVWTWIFNNAAPAEYPGTQLLWAYGEMPIGSITHIPGWII